MRYQTDGRGAPYGRAVPPGSSSNAPPPLWEFFLCLSRLCQVVLLHSITVNTESDTWPFPFRNAIPESSLLT